MVRVWPVSPAAGGDASAPGGGRTVLDARPQTEPSRPAAAFAAGLLPLPSALYYPADRLTKRPQPAVGIDLDGPETRTIIASGKMILWLRIEDDGNVTEVEVERSELPGAFANAAITAFKHARFIPGELDGRRVGSVMRVEITYDDNRYPNQ